MFKRRRRVGRGGADYATMTWKWSLGAYIIYRVRSRRGGITMQTHIAKAWGWSLDAYIEGQGGGAGRVIILSCLTVGRRAIDPRIPTIPGRSTSGFDRPSRHCLHQSRKGGVNDRSTAMAWRRRLDAYIFSGGQQGGGGVNDRPIATRCADGARTPRAL